MPAEPTPCRGPTEAEDTLVFQLADPDHRLRAVRLYQEVRVPAELQDFSHDGARWVLELERPDVDRMEYLFEVTGSDGRTSTIQDPVNPRRVSGAFGDKSVLELAGYTAPSWLERPGPPGRRRSLTVSTRSMVDDVEVTIWSPDRLGDTAPAPLVLVHDGPEYDRLAGFTAYLSSMVAGGDLPPVRAALLGPGSRNESYSADGAYTRALCLAVIPRLRAEVPATAVVGVGASLGALAMLHAQRQHTGCVDALFLQSGSFFHPRHDAHERRFSRYDRVVRSVDSVLRAGRHPAPVPTVMTCGTLEENLANNRIMARALAAQGYDVTLREVRDVHSFTAWRDSLHPWLTGLLREVAQRDAS